MEERLVENAHAFITQITQPLDFLDVAQQLFGSGSDEPFDNGRRYKASAPPIHGLPR